MRADYSRFLREQLETASGNDRDAARVRDIYKL